MDYLAACKFSLDKHVRFNFIKRIVFNIYILIRLQSTWFQFARVGVWFSLWSLTASEHLPPINLGSLFCINIFTYPETAYGDRLRSNTEREILIYLDRGFILLLLFL